MAAATGNGPDDPIPCTELDTGEAMGGISGCGLFGWIAFALAFGGMGVINWWSWHGFASRSETVQGVLVAPGYYEEPGPGGKSKRRWLSGQRILQFTASDGVTRARELPGKGRLPTGATIAALWSGPGLGELHTREHMDGQVLMSWVFMGIGGAMLLGAVAIARGWSAAKMRRRALQAHNQRVPGVRCKVRHYLQRRWNRYRIQVTFQAPDGRWFRAESEPYRQDPAPAIKDVPSVLLDPDRPERSIVAPDSLPPSHW